MNTKLSVAFLSGVSLFMSIGAFAVSDIDSSDDLNWSYVMGETKPMTAPDTVSAPVLPEPTTAPRNITCTAGCPPRPRETTEPLTLTYEDEAMPLAERVATSAEDVPAPAPVSTPVSIQKPTETQPVANDVPAVKTIYVDTPQKTQYPITRQYPISVQYPVTVQRNMTVEQPVIMQQPVVVRRPIVMQQDITVQRQPTIIQQQPMVMQQQPSFIQQQPIFVQAPAGNINPMMMGGLNTQTLPTLPTSFVIPQQSVPVPYMPYTMPAQPGQYQIQGQIQAQPLFAQPMMMSVPQPQVQNTYPMVAPQQPSQQQQPVYQN